MHFYGRTITYLSGHLDALLTRDGVLGILVISQVGLGANEDYGDVLPGVFANIGHPNGLACVQCLLVDEGEAKNEHISARVAQTPQTRVVFLTRSVESD